MPISYSARFRDDDHDNKRPPPITVATRAAISEAELADAAPTLTAAAIAAMTSPGVIRPACSATLEVESNRLKRATTVTLRRGDTLAAVGAAGGRDPAVVLSGRRNPTNKTNTAGTGELVAVAFAGPVAGAAIIPHATADAADVGWTVSSPATGTAPLVRTPVVPDADGNGFAWRGQTGAGPWPVGTTINSARGTVAYAQPAGMSRDFTVAAAVRVNAATQAHFRYLLRDAGNAHAATVDGPTFLLGTPGALSRYASTVTLPDQGVARYWTTVGVQLVIDSATAADVWIDAVEFYAGPDRGPLIGLHVAAPAPQAVAELTWTDRRHVNRVEVSGERRLGRITSARVQVTTDGATWTDAGVGWGGGRLAVLLDQTYLALGVRVWIEETTAGVGGQVWIFQVDPMLVLDVTDDVASLSVRWAREADPGQATTPVGNFQSAEVSLELDNTRGDYTPASNASLDTGHRIEAALGVRYSSLQGNPRLDVDAAGWTGNGSRAYPAAPGAPTAASYRATAVGAGPSTAAAYGYSPLVVGLTAGVTYRLSAWVMARAELRSTEGDSIDDSAAFVCSWPVDAAGGLVMPAGGLGVVQASRSGRFQRLTTTVVMPAGAAGLHVLAGVFGPSGSTYYTTEVTEVAIEELDGLGEPVDVVELLPAGVFYSDPWDAPTGATTVQITGNDRLARQGSTSVTEDVRTGQAVSAILADLALRYLDCDDDQVSIDPTAGTYVVPYCTPPDAGDLSTYVADLAKAVLGAVYIDPLERFTLEPRGFTPPDAATEIRADNALIGQSRPVTADQAVAVVVATAEPMTPQAPASVYQLPAPGLQLAPSQVYQLVCDYDTSPAVTAAVTGVTADGGYAIDSVVTTATRAIVTLRNTSAVAVRTFATLEITATPLAAGSLARRVVDQPSLDRYGPRELDVAARLVQTQAQLDVIAAALLDQFRGIDDNGTRKLSDVQLDTLGLLHLDVGDLVTIVDPDAGVGAGYVLIARQLTYAATGSLLASSTARQAQLADFAIADVSIADDTAVAGY